MFALKYFWFAMKPKLIAISIYIVYAINKFFIYPYMVKLVNSNHTTLDNKLLALGAALISYLGDNDSNREFDKIFHLNVASGLDTTKIKKSVCNKRINMKKLINK